MTATLGIYTVAIQRHYQAQKSQLVNQELRYAMELMSRDIKESFIRDEASSEIYLANLKKLGNDYYNLCMGTDVKKCLKYKIDSSSDQQKNGIWAKGLSDDTDVRLTSPDIEIESPSRFIANAEAYPAKDNPRVTILIKAKARNDEKGVSEITLQATVSQKEIENYYRKGVFTGQ
jgi:hypothetical protein